MLWQPSERAVEDASLTQFARQLIRKRKLEVNSYPEFYRWSVENPEEFWADVWDFCGVQAARKGSTVLVDGGKMPGAHWFPEARLNLAQNLLRRGDRGDAFVFWDETGFKRRLSYSDLTSAVTLDEWLRRYQPADINYAQLPFDHPVFILFTSGTTGTPKCIVHGAGGSLLQSVKTYKLHFDVRPGDRFFYYCTTNWVVWNVLFMGLAAEASLMLYDGSPFARGGKILFDYAEKERFTHFGTSAKFIDACAKRDLRPRETHDLAALRMIVSTGSPLVAESYDYVYDAWKKDVCLSSISGGTDIMGAFADANAVLPVYRGEMQCRSLGMAIDVYDEDGNPLLNQKGELVCTKPFPSMPLGFWNDRGGERYHAAYFAKYANVWCHGDWAELTDRGTMIIYGRSDATLNPGGVRIGTAEIYRVVERIHEVEESVAIGQLWPPEEPTDTRVVLFLKLRPGYTLEAELEERIRAEIRRHASPRHVPARIVQVPDIPRTKNGKVVELAVKAVVHGMPVPNTDALANPEALDYFANLAELAA